MTRSRERDGLKNQLQFAALTNFEPVWEFLHSRPRLRRLTNHALINSAVLSMPTRPNPLSTLAPYTSWSSLTEGGTLSVDVQRVKAGRKQGKTCKAGAKKGKKCTVISKVASYKLGVGGSSTVALPKKKLAAGDYRAVVTPIDAAGNKGAAKTVSFKVLKK